MRNTISFSFAALFMISSAVHAADQEKTEVIELPAIVITSSYPTAREISEFSAQDQADRQAEESLSKLVEAKVSTEKTDD